MDFPVEDVVKNVRHFISSVRKATGNTKEAQQSNKGKGSPRPGMSFTFHPICLFLTTYLIFFPVVPIKKVMLSSRQGPGIRIADI